MGFAIVKELRSRGYRLSPGALDVGQLAEKCGSETADTLYQFFDAFDAPTATNWVDRTVKKFGQIDGIVNAIGVCERVAIMDDNDASLDRLWEVYTKASGCVIDNRRAVHIPARC